MWMLRIQTRGQQKSFGEFSESLISDRRGVLPGGYGLSTFSPADKHLRHGDWLML
jgi:hypothetical protein